MVPRERSAGAVHPGCDAIVLPLPTDLSENEEMRRGSNIWGVMDPN